MGRARRGRGVLARGASIRTGPTAVRAAARSEPADPVEARQYADRDRARIGSGATRRTSARRRPSAPGDGVADQAQFLRQGAGDCAHGARYAWCEWHSRRVSRDPAYDEPRGRQHLRRHTRHPRADPRASTDGDPGLLVTPDVRQTGQASSLSRDADENEWPAAGADRMEISDPEM